MSNYLAVEENLRATLSLFSLARADGEVLELPGLVAVCAGVHFSTFNAVVLTAPVEKAEELRARLEVPARYFRRRRLPWSLWLCEEWLAAPLRRKADDLLETAGMRRLISMPGMLAERLAPTSRTLPLLLIRRVEDQATRQAFERLMTATFDVPPTISHQIYGAAALWENGLVGWVGYLGQVPVSCAATRVAGGVIGLYAVGTLPAFQRQGYGETVARHAIERAQAASGLTISALQATPAGFKLYQRMGFRTVTRYSIYAAYP